MSSTTIHTSASSQAQPSFPRKDRITSSQLRTTSSHSLAVASRLDHAATAASAATAAPDHIAASSTRIMSSTRLRIKAAHHLSSIFIFSIHRIEAKFMKRPTYRMHAKSAEAASARAHGAQTALPHTFSSSTADTCNTNRDNLTTDRRTHSQRAPLGPSTRGPAPRLRPLRVRRWTGIAYPCSRSRALYAHRHYRSATAARAVSCKAPTTTEPAACCPPLRCHPCFAARRGNKLRCACSRARAHDTPRARHATTLPQVHGTQW